MANKQRGEGKLMLGEVERTLRYDLNALAELEDALGVPLSELGNIEMKIKNVRSILWAGLLHEDESLTEKEVGKHITIDNMEEVQKAIGEAFGGVPAKN